MHTHTRTRPLRPLRLALLAALVLPLLIAHRPTGAQTGAGLERLVGESTFGNPALVLPEDKPYVLLFDLTAYIERDPEYVSDVDAQVIGPVTGSADAGIEFELLLPIAPRADEHAFGNSTDAGVQVYSLELMYEYDGAPFAEPAETTGWPSALSSVEWSSDTQDATGGQLVVWAADDEQVFPSGFGEDGLLFTDDDPTEPLEPGWTGIDLSRATFTTSREPDYEMEIIEGDTWYYDLSDLGYVDAFTELIDTLEIRYPFTNEKGIDWDELRDEYLPRVEHAEQQFNVDEYAEILYEFGMSFGDGHVSASLPESVYDEEFSGFLGVQFVQTDRGELVVSWVWEGFSLGGAGIEVGAEILTWNGRSAERAVAREQAILPTSSERAEHYWQVDSLSWGSVGDEVEIEYRNRGGEVESTTLTYDAFPDLASYQRQFQYDAASEDPTVLPVTAEILPSGVGYIRITSFYDDPLLTVIAWEAALRSFEYAEIRNVIVDLRGNGGGWVSSALDMASFVSYDEPVVFDNTAVDPATGTVVDMSFGLPENDVPYEFDVAVLVDAACMSSCELFAAATSQSPNVVIVGTTATGGGVSTVSEWSMPDGLVFRSSTTRTALAGEPLLEGVGVEPDIDVRITLRSAQNPDDEVLEAAIEELTG